MTGSALNIYNGGAPVTRQVELAKAVFAAGVPFFGSCWGLQVAVTAAGGEVRANPSGREFGFARRVLLNDAGRKHALFAGKPAAFEAPTIHRDSVTSAAVGRGDAGDQRLRHPGARFTHARGTFWGVQYHPEYDYQSTLPQPPSATARSLVTDGMFRDMAALTAFASELRALQVQTPADEVLLWKHGLGPAMRSEPVRLAEIRNWLERNRC
jgi:GMP synthase (glutamine-hydrolysing)